MKYKPKTKRREYKRNKIRELVYLCLKENGKATFSQIYYYVVENMPKSFTLNKPALRGYMKAYDFLKIEVKFVRDKEGKSRRVVWYSLENR